MTGITYPVYSTLQFVINKGQERGKRMADSQIRNEEHSESERSVEVEAQKAKCAEEPLHHQVCEITEDMESPECSARAEEATHEVDNDVKDENTACRHRYIGQGICDGDSGGSVHAIAGLEGSCKRFVRISVKIIAHLFS